MFNPSTIAIVLGAFSFALIVSGAVTKVVRVQNHLVTLGFTLAFATGLVMTSTHSTVANIIGFLIALVFAILVFGYTVGVRNQTEA